MEKTTISILFGFIASFLGVYSLLIVIRIILTWFAHVRYSKPVQILSGITDPYLNWWRSKLNLRVGVLDLSPIVGITFLSVAQTLCARISYHGKITLGVVIGLVLIALRSIILFILGFCFVILVLRFIAYKANFNIYSPFWQVIDTISKPLLYRINRIVFGKRLIRFSTAIITAIIALALLWIAVQAGAWALSGLLMKMPV